MREFIEIRSNITPTINWLNQLELDKAEKEKQEREARWAREREERERKEAEWKAEHPILDRYTYISQWNYETYCYQGNSVNFYFYEWSNLNSEPISFSFDIPFYKFLDKCKIDFTDKDNEKIKTHRTCHIICKPGCNSLIIATTYDKMKEEFERVATVGKVIASVPTVDKDDSEVKVLSCKVYDQDLDYA